jgi:hypothetical protein
MDSTHNEIFARDTCIGERANGFVRYSCVRVLRWKDFNSVGDGHDDCARPASVGEDEQTVNGRSGAVLAKMVHKVIRGAKESPQELVGCFQLFRTIFQGLSRRESLVEQSSVCAPGLIQILGLNWA